LFALLHVHVYAGCARRARTTPSHTDAQFAAATPDDVPTGTKKLVRLSDASGKLTLKEEASGKVR
jgi:hypothetical protein